MAIPILKKNNSKEFIFQNKKRMDRLPSKEAKISFFREAFRFKTREVVISKRKSKYKFNRKTKST